MVFRSIKTYGHEVGLSACFRQHAAQSHCSLLHGYALSFEFTFQADELDDRNWVIDFGGLKGLKKKLEDAFDHRLLVADDDPKLDDILRLQELGLADVRVVPKVGCEAFAEQAYRMAFEWLYEVRQADRVQIVSVKVSEHGANSALYKVK